MAATTNCLIIQKREREREWSKSQHLLVNIFKEHCKMVRVVSERKRAEDVDVDVVKMMLLFLLILVLVQLTTLSLSLSISLSLYVIYNNIQFVVIDCKKFNILSSSLSVSFFCRLLFADVS